MHRPSGRVKASAWFLVVGAFLTLAGFQTWAPVEGAWGGLMRALGPGLLLLSLVEPVPEFFQRRHEEREELEFTRFFGEEILSGGVALVSGGRTIADEHLHYLRPDPELHLPSNAVPTGVGHWLAESDIRAGGYLSEMFGRKRVPVRYRTAQQVAQDDYRESSSVVPGLGFNAETVGLLAITKEKPPLFTIDWKKVRGTGRVTDTFAISDHPIPEQREGFDVALIVRIPVGQHVHFVAAGRSAHGTAAAGHFLAHKWERLAALYAQHKKQLAAEPLAVVIEHPTGGPRETKLDSGGEVVDYSWRESPPGKER